MSNATRPMLYIASRHRAEAAAWLLACCIPSSNVAAQSFDKLTACDDVAQLRRDVDKDPELCGGAEGRIARSIQARSRNPLCFFRSALKSLEGFECAQPIGYPEVTCFRPAAAGIVQKIQTNFREGFDRVVAKYIDDASRCPYSSGRASPAPTNMIAFGALGWVAKADLAFGAETGKRDMSDGVAVHGYASTDPDVGGLPKAVEYLHVYGTRCRAPNCSNGRTDEGDYEIERADGLVLLRQADDVSIQQINTQMRRNGLPIRYSAATFIIDAAPLKFVGSIDHIAEWRRRTAAIPSKQASIIPSIANAARTVAEEEGFRKLDLEEFTEAGRSLAQLTRNQLRLQPYALRSVSAPPEFEYLVKDSGTGCFRNGGVLLVLGRSGSSIFLFSGGILDCKYRGSYYLDKMVQTITLKTR